MITLPYLTEPPGAYAGVGSRETPEDALDLMNRIGKKFAEHGWRLRSGAAPGADTAFEIGALCAYVDDASEIFLPWLNFEGHASSHSRPSSEARALAARFHPNWAACSPAAQALLARNAHQVLGADLRTPSRFVVCWTPDGATSTTTHKTGGTGQAIRIAAAYNVPVWNLQRADHRAAWEALIT